MLTLLSLVALAGGATLLAMGAAWTLEALDRRRLRRVAAQVRVTEAVHGALGAIVAPTVDRGTAGRWRVTMRLAARDLPAAGPLAEIAREALAEDGEGAQVVFAPRAGV
jgi:hypothetical protein